MGKPRLIILIRHAQSEGNKNKAIHQVTPDHRVPLTEEGRDQALKCGQSLRKLLRPTDTIHFFTSPYRRTRETTEGIITSLTSNEAGPSPFPRHTIKVYEEPRLREQDFGNFQPGEEAMAQMWKQRAEYGHFFFRIPNGESAADAYDRISGFNDSLWRRFSEDDFASVCILVTHGLMTRVFLMKWYHFSVEYFEDLRNVGHCEMTVLKKGENGKYVLQNQLRTWSELRRERAARDSIFSGATEVNPIPTRRRWAACPDDCNNTEHNHSPQRKRVPIRQTTADLFKDDNELLPMSPPKITSTSSLGRSASVRDKSMNGSAGPSALSHTTTSASTAPTSHPHVQEASIVEYPASKSRPISYGGRDGGGSKSGAASPFGSSEEDDGEPSAPQATANRLESSPVEAKSRAVPARSLARALRGQLDSQSSTPIVALADALGDQSDVEVEEAEAEAGESNSNRSSKEMELIIEEERRDRSVRESIF